MCLRFVSLYPVVRVGLGSSPARYCLELVCLGFCRGSLWFGFRLLWFGGVCCLFDRLRLPLLLFEVCCGWVECLLLPVGYFELAPFDPLVDFLFVVVPVVVRFGLAPSGLFVVALFLVVPVVVVCFGFAGCGLLVVVLFVLVSVVGVCCNRVVFHVLLVGFVRSLG